MKQTLGTSHAADLLRADENANWSWNGAVALVEYLEQLEDDTGQEIEFDKVAIRCDFSEYDSLQAFAAEYGDIGFLADLADLDTPDERDAAVRDYIEERGTLIEFDGGVIVSAF